MRLVLQELTAFPSSPQTLHRSFRNYDGLLLCSGKKARVTTISFQTFTQVTDIARDPEAAQCTFSNLCEGIARVGLHANKVITTLLHVSFDSFLPLHSNMRSGELVWQCQDFIDIASRMMTPKAFAMVDSGVVRIAPFEPVFQYNGKRCTLPQWRSVLFNVDLIAMRIYFQQKISFRQLMERASVPAWSILSYVGGVGSWSMSAQTQMRQSDPSRHGLLHRQTDRFCNC